MRFASRDLISIRDLTREDVEYLLKTADLMEPMARRGSDILRGKIMASLFFEPSTRTRLSFESAMQRLGGGVIGFSEVRTTSMEKGENLVDTLRVVENYADVIVIRHPMDGVAKAVAEFVNVPVINAGSGSEEHPTQALVDLYTIYREKGTIDGLCIALLGDLRYSRAIHSLIYALSMYNIKLYLVSPNLLKIRREYLDDIRDKVEVKEAESLDSCINEIDVLYVTRIQKERFLDASEYEKVKGTYQVTAELLTRAKRDMIILHPLPRCEEIAPDVDMTIHAKYFKQTLYGLYVRMALLALILGAID